MSREMLIKKLAIIQQQIQLKLEEIREIHQHKGNKGANVEQIIREFLSVYFPADNRIGQGEIIDTEGNVTSQLDVIMTNQYHPYINDLSQPSLYFVEGVACAGEIKSVLNSQDLNTILKNCLRYKELNIRLSAGMTIHSTESDTKRFIEKRPYFLFAFESQLTLNTVYEKVSEFSANNCPNIWQQIDGIFLLDRGSIINFGDGKGSFQFRDPEGISKPGIIRRPLEAEPNLLFSFVAWISAVIERFTIYDNILTSYLMKGQMS